jgi:protein TonB
MTGYKMVYRPVEIQEVAPCEYTYGEYDDINACECEAVACERAVGALNDDIEEQVIRGDIIYRDVFNFNAAGDVADKTIFCYDADGLLLESNFKLTYDSAGNITGIEWTIEDLIGTISYSCTYDSKGNIIEEKWYNADGELISVDEFDFHNRVTDWVDSDELGYSLYEEVNYYDSDANLIAMSESPSDSGSTINCWYNYDENGNILERFEHIHDDIYESTRKWSYGRDGNITEMAQYDGIGDLEYKIKYDCMGNIIEKINYEYMSHFEYNIVYADGLVTGPAVEPMPSWESVAKVDSMMARTDQTEPEKPKAEQKKVQTKVLTDALTIVSNDTQIETPDIIFTEDTPEFDDFEFDMEVVEEEIDDSEEIFTILEDPATFQGGGIAEFRKWAMHKGKYPQIAQDNGIQGNVVVEFVIDEEGKIGRIQVLQSPDPVLTEAAVKVLEEANKLKKGWKPGKLRGKAVKQKFVLPVSFKLSH